MGMSENSGLLSGLFLRLLGACIIEYDQGPQKLRFLVESPIATLLSPDQQAIQVVLEGYRDLYYLSYTQKQEERLPLQDLELVFSKPLQILGLEERDESELILYCSSCQEQLEAGELHVRAHSFQLYDQEFGFLTYEQFCHAADKHSRFTA